jgi:hypothetical protein
MRERRSRRFGTACLAAVALMALLGSVAEGQRRPGRAPVAPAEQVAPMANAPSASALAARHDSLMGGREALEGLTSIRLLGRFSIPAAGLDAPLEILKRKPNTFVFRTVLGDQGEVVQGFDGAVAWSLRPGEGARLLQGGERAQVEQQADFFGDLHDLSRFASAETIGAVEFEGRPTWQVRLIRPSGDTLYEYFDRETGLSAGGAMDIPTGIGRVRQKTLYGDYRSFGPLRIATTIIQRQPDFDVIIRIAFVELDEVRESDLALPDAVKALIP